MTTPNLETVAVFRDLLDAELARSMLESEGIEAEVADDATIGANWAYSAALGGVKVQVPTHQFEQAAALLAADPLDSAGDLDVETGERILPSTCPECQGSAIEQVNHTRKAAALFLLIGLPLAWFGKFQRCKECGARW